MDIGMLKKSVGRAEEIISRLESREEKILRNDVAIMLEVEMLTSSIGQYKEFKLHNLNGKVPENYVLQKWLELANEIISQYDSLNLKGAIVEGEGFFKKFNILKTELGEEKKKNNGLESEADKLKKSVLQLESLSHTLQTEKNKCEKKMSDLEKALRLWPTLHDQHFPKSDDSKWDQKGDVSSK